MEEELRKKVNELFKAYRKDKSSLDKEIKYQTYKSILECALKMAKDARTQVSEEIVLKAAKKEIRQAEEVLPYCENDDERKMRLNMAILHAKEFLPDTIPDERIAEFVRKHKSSANNRGSMMKMLREKYGKDIDMKRASVLVNEEFLK